MKMTAGLNPDCHFLLTHMSACNIIILTVRSV